MLLSPTAELEHLLSRSSSAIAESIAAGAKAIVRGDLAAERLAMRRAGEQVAASRGLADLLGRRRVWLEVDHVRRRPAARDQRRAAYAMTSVYSPVIPQVPFKEAIADLLSREPRLATGAAEVSALYSDSHAFAIAQSLDLTVTRKVQESLGRILASGADRDREAAAFVEIEGWSPNYAATVQRTNLSTSYTAGRFRQAQDPDVEETIVGLRRVAVLDSDCRKNHEKAHGFIAGQHDPVWGYMAPPWGYNERCGLELVDVYEARREGLLVNGRLPPGRPISAPDPGFSTGATWPRPGAYRAPRLILAPSW